MPPLQTPGSALLQGAFVAIAVAVGGLLPLAFWRAGFHAGHHRRRRWQWTRRAALFVIAFVWGTHTMAQAGLFRFGPVPPPLVLVVLGSFALNLAFCWSRLGTHLAGHLSWAGLCGFQVFRIPVELFLWQAHREHLIPERMTFEGWNFDVVSGVLGAAVGIVAMRRSPPRWMLVGYNVIGTALLLNIVVIAILSMPTPLRMFHEGPANTLVAHPPYPWLPLVLVQAAAMGHLLCARKLGLQGLGPAGTVRPSAREVTPGPTAAGRARAQMLRRAFCLFCSAHANPCPTGR